MATISNAYAVVHAVSKTKTYLTIEYETCDRSLTHCKDVGDVHIADIVNGPKEQDTKVGTPPPGKVIQFYQYIGGDTTWWNDIGVQCIARDDQTMYFDFDWTKPFGHRVSCVLAK